MGSSVPKLTNSSMACHAIYANLHLDAIARSAAAYINFHAPLDDIHEHVEALLRTSHAALAEMASLASMT